MDVNQMQDIFANSGTQDLPFSTKMLIYLLILIVVSVFAFFSKSYRENIFYIIKNVLILFKRFFHWNISKIIIYIYSILVGTLFSSVFIVLSYYIFRNLSSRFDPTSMLSLVQTGKLNPALITSFLENIWLVLLLVLNVGIIFSFYVFAFIYGDILLQNVYRNYLIGKKLAFTDNWYFSFKHMGKYLGVLGWVGLYLLRPLLILLVGFLVLFGLSYSGVLSWAQGDSGNIILGVVTFIIFASSLYYFFYLGIRLAFSYIAFIFSRNLNVNSKLYIEESLSVTKGKVWKIIGIGIPFFIIGAMIGDIFALLETDSQILNFAVSILYFLIFGGISYMIYMSIYLALKKGDRYNIENILMGEKE
ncbi:MAG: hypothetical protein PHS92_05280 [Candidatus Gracilibacteria bacterium]|nr:hypothetical protein [Candidatus Gracilibacteria bacterium]